MKLTSDTFFKSRQIYFSEDRQSWMIEFEFALWTVMPGWGQLSERLEAQHLSVHRLVLRGRLVMHMKLDIFLFGCWAMWGSIVKCVNLCSNDHDPWIFHADGGNEGLCVSMAARDDEGMGCHEVSCRIDRLACTAWDSAKINVRRPQELHRLWDDWSQIPFTLPLELRWVQAKSDLWCYAAALQWWGQPWEPWDWWFVPALDPWRPPLLASFSCQDWAQNFFPDGKLLRSADPANRCLAVDYASRTSTRGDPRNKIEKC